MDLPANIDLGMRRLVVGLFREDSSYYSFEDAFYDLSVDLKCCLYY
jgi:hypothetical protein